MGGAAIFDLDRTLLQGGTGPLLSRAMYDLGVVTRKLPGERLLYGMFDLIGETPEIYLAGDRPETGFISEPDIFVVLVAAFAGVAGALSLTEARSGPLVGVFISVTTIPAIAEIGVALAIDPDQAGGAALQLLINVTVLIVVGVVTIWVQRGLLRRYHRLRQASFSTNDSS